MGVRGQNAAQVTLNHVFAWRRTTRWRNTEAMSMKVDPGNHTRWKHKWESGTNRVWVWHNTASEWSGEEQRRRCQCEERIKRDFVFFALDYVERSVTHRPKIGGEVKAIVDEERTEETGPR